MNWSSVKNLLIAILVAANLFLIFNVARQDRTRDYISDSELRDAVELLADRGFSVPADIIPTKKFKTPVYESRYDDEYYTTVATTLADSEREMLYTLPNGGISISTKGGAYMEFDNEFDFRYFEFDNPDSAAYTEITADTFAEHAQENEPVGASRMKALSKAASDFLRGNHSKDSPLEVKAVGAFTDTEGRTVLLAEQHLNGYKVYSHYAVCIFENSEIVFAHGRWYFSETDKDYNTDLYDQIHILFTDMSTVKSTIASAVAASEDEQEGPAASLESNENITLPAVSAVTACYVVYWNANKTALYFIPAWQIDHTPSLTVVYNAANATVYSSDK